MANHQNTDWTKCFLCQCHTIETLKDPSRDNNVHSVKESGSYVTLATNIQLFQEKGKLPITLDPSRLDDGSGILDTICKNNAKFHNTCKLKFSTSMLK